MILCSTHVPPRLLQDLSLLFSWKQHGPSVGHHRDGNVPFQVSGCPLLQKRTGSSQALFKVLSLEYQNRNSNSPTTEFSSTSRGACPPWLGQKHPKLCGSTTEELSSVEDKLWRNRNGLFDRVGDMGPTEANSHKRARLYYLAV